MLLLIGAILCEGGRIACRALKVFGLKEGQALTNYHGVLNRAESEAFKGAKGLLCQITRGLGITELVVAIDDRTQKWKKEQG